MTIKIGLKPQSSSHNSFVASFAECFPAPLYATSSYKVRHLLSQKLDIVVFHWPDRYLSPSGPMDFIKNFISIALMFIAKTIHGTKFLWAAHNINPHDRGNTPNLARVLFFRSLDGVIFFSQNSRDLVTATYPELAAKAALVTRHGHYRLLMRSLPQPRTAIEHRAPHLVYFGVIRPYKSVEMLVDIIGLLPDIRLTVAGKVEGAQLAQSIRFKAEDHANISLDLRQDILSDGELESAIDAADAVVLPYRNILNSGSILFALSRNRPVLAPRMGSLPEMQAHVGPDWVTLYDGELTPQIVEAFCAGLKHSPLGTSPNLSAYDWEGIAKDLQGFVTTIQRQNVR